MSTKSPRRPPGYFSLLLFVVEFARRDLKRLPAQLHDNAPEMHFLRSRGLHWLLELGGIEYPDEFIKGILRD